jgi:hypothetical protein
LSTIHPRMDCPGASPFSGFIGAWFSAVRTEDHAGRSVNEGSLRPQKFEVQPTPTTGELFNSVGAGFLESREADGIGPKNYPHPIREWIPRKQKRRPCE